MVPQYLSLLLADDDQDDCLFFKEALDELQVSTQLTTVHDGEQLMLYLTKKTTILPNILFLDLNMPRKNGLECLAEIKLDKTLSKLPVIIFSTSYDQKMINLLYENGAQFYIRKPSDFTKLKIVIQRALVPAAGENTSQAAVENFVINSN